MPSNVVVSLAFATPETAVITLSNAMYSVLVAFVVPTTSFIASGEIAICSPNANPSSWNTLSMTCTFGNRLNPRSIRPVPLRLDTVSLL